MRKRASLLGVCILLSTLGACSWSFSDPDGGPGMARWNFKEDRSESWRFESPLTNNYGAVGPSVSALSR